MKEIIDFAIKCSDSDIHTSSPYYRLPMWPPPADWPVSIHHKNGEILSKYEDNIWKLSSRRITTINFCEGSYLEDIDNSKTKRIQQNIDSRNIDLFKKCTSWLHWGNRPRVANRTLVSYSYTLKPIFVICARENVLATRLSRHPLVVAQIAQQISPSTQIQFLSLLHELWEVREVIGIALLSPSEINAIAAFFEAHNQRQKPYIPPRIYTYQINRLKECLTDFLAHQDQFIQLYKYIEEQYLENTPNPTHLFLNRSVLNEPIISPFYAKASSYVGPFIDTVRKFGLLDLLSRWITVDQNIFQVKTISKYINLIQAAGNKLIICYTGMRIEESRTLRSDCLIIDDDPDFGKIFIIRGETTKTDPDSDARWITSPDVRLAIDAMKITSKLICEFKALDDEDPISESDLNNPYLIQSSTHPWSGGKLTQNFEHAALNTRMTYGHISNYYPKLLKDEGMIIDEEDLKTARLVTPDLDPDIYKVGSRWVISDHQLRRTLAVNMLASRIVGDASLQYQFKHQRRAQSLYYGHGFSRLVINESFGREYTRATFELLYKQLAEANSSRYSSPLGSTHTNTLLSHIDPLIDDAPISRKTIKRMQDLSTSGAIAWRTTLLGVCTNLSPCSYGGISNIVNCQTCGHALYDKLAYDDLKDLESMLRDLLSQSSSESPNQISIKAQLETLKNYFHVINDKH